MKNRKGALWPSGLERWTGDRMVLGSNPAAATLFASELWQFRLPHFVSVSRSVTVQRKTLPALNMEEA